MRKPYLLVAFLFTTIAMHTMADDTGVAAKFCAEENIQQKLKDPNNRMAFRNKGGIANGGVCWWHSRFTRNANYLAYFSPEKEKPHNKVSKIWSTVGGKRRHAVITPAPGSLKYILKKIKAGKEVVEIPGYSNLKEFTTENQNEIQKLLDNWQIEDGVIKQQWVVGLAGSSVETPEKMQSIMETLYERVSAGEVVYQKLQLKGITAHAWLVVGMETTVDGYKLMIIDSNTFTVDTYVYRFGDTSMKYKYWGNFVPYVGNVREENRIKNVRLEFCNNI